MLYSLREFVLAAKEKLEIVLSAPVQGEAGGRGVWGGNSARRAQRVPFGYFQTDSATRFMKIFNVSCIIFLLVLLGTGCANGTRDNERTQNSSVTFQESDIESEFTLPPGWTYQKDASEMVEGIRNFQIFDQNKNPIGGVVFFDASFSDQVETAIDTCVRQWDIGSEPEFRSGWEPLDGNFYLDRYVVLLKNQTTSVAVESCPDMNGKQQAFFSWIPLKVITNFWDSAQYFHKLPVRRMILHDVTDHEEDFRNLIREIAQSLNIKK